MNVNRSRRGRHALAPLSVARKIHTPPPDFELIARYDGRGPRYTSYPTALQFDEAFGQIEYRAAVAAAETTAFGRPLSLYVHIPFCADPCFYCACTKVITRQPAVANAYLQRLELEIARQASLFTTSRRVTQLHFGGGTPTFLNIDQLGCLLGALARNFNLDPHGDREFSIEIDPRTVDEATLNDLVGLGFNRASFGIQDFDPAVQAAINRIQPAKSTLNLLSAARRTGFRSISADVIYGLPLQAIHSLQETLDLLIEARPDRIAAYSYAHLPHRFKPQRQINEKDLPDAVTKFHLLEYIVERLLDAGYVHIGMDHFALPEDDLSRALERGDLQRNFQGYSTCGGLDLVGLGMSSISRIDDIYSQNAWTLPAYNASIDEGGLAVRRGLRLSAEDRLRRDVIEAIMCSGIVGIGHIEERHHIDFRRHFSKELRKLQPMSDDGLITDTGDALKVTPLGRFLLRPLAMVFDGYLPQTTVASASTPAEARYSRVI